jgi:hypothetical protein
MRRGWPTWSWAVIMVFAILNFTWVWVGPDYWLRLPLLVLNATLAGTALLIPLRRPFLKQKWIDEHRLCPDCGYARRAYIVRRGATPPLRRGAVLFECLTTNCPGIRKRNAPR